MGTLQGGPRTGKNPLRTQTLLEGCAPHLHTISPHPTPPHPRLLSVTNFSLASWCAFLPKPSRQGSWGLTGVKRSLSPTNHIFASALLSAKGILCLTETRGGRVGREETDQYHKRGLNQGGFRHKEFTHHHHPHPSTAEADAAGLSINKCIAMVLSSASHTQQVH